MKLFLQRRAFAADNAQGEKTEGAMADKGKGAELAKRMAKYGGAIIIAADELPDTKTWRHVRDQMIRHGCRCPLR